MLHDWPDGTRRPYLPVVRPHCLVDTRQLRCERFRFADMHELLEHLAYMLFQSVETLEITASDGDEDGIAMHRRTVLDDAETLRMIAAASGYGPAEAEVWATRAAMAGRASAEALLRNGKADPAEFHPRREMP